MKQHARKGIAEFFQGLGGQFFNKQFNEEVLCVHGNFLIAAGACVVGVRGEFVA